MQLVDPFLVCCVDVPHFCFVLLLHLHYIGDQLLQIVGFGFQLLRQLSGCGILVLLMGVFRDLSGKGSIVVAILEKYAIAFAVLFHASPPVVDTVASVRQKPLILPPFLHLRHLQIEARLAHFSYYF